MPSDPPTIPEPEGSPRASRWLLPVSLLAVAVHLLGLYWPGSPDAPGFGFPGADKIAHVLLFAVPVWLLGRLTGRVRLIAGIFVAHAVASELIQHRFLPHRSGDPWDLVADLVGIVAAVTVLTRRGRAGRP